MTERRPRVVFLINGAPGSAGGERVRRIAKELHDEDVRLIYRSGSRTRDLPRFLRAATSPGSVLYAMDMAAVPVAAGAIGALTGPLIIDTGDSPTDFLRLISAGRLKTAAADLLERTGYRSADAVIVRGPYHAALLHDRGVRSVHIVPDGVDLELVQPVEDCELRRRLGLADVFTVGIAGFFSWFESLGGGPGSELVHAIAARRDLPMHAVLIGDGPGLPMLRTLAHRLGVGERVHMLGRVPYTELGRYLGLCDACVLTLSNDPAGWVRTTGKLPGYLAAGRYVVATRVGTAADLLPDEMLLEFDGAWDLSYPARLAQRLAEVATDPDRREKGLALRALADRFDYRRVAKDAAAVIHSAGGGLAGRVRRNRIYQGDEVQGHDDDRRTEGLGLHDA